MASDSAVKVAVVTGIFVVVAAIVTGGFTLLNQRMSDASPSPAVVSVGPTQTPTPSPTTPRPVPVPPVTTAPVTTAPLTTPPVTTPPVTARRVTTPPATQKALAVQASNILKQAPSVDRAPVPTSLPSLALGGDVPAAGTDFVEGSSLVPASLIGTWAGIMKSTVYQRSWTTAVKLADTYDDGSAGAIAGITMMPTGAVQCGGTLQLIAQTTQTVLFLESTTFNPTGECVPSELLTFAAPSNGGVVMTEFDSATGLVIGRSATALVRS